MIDGAAAVVCLPGAEEVAGPHDLRAFASGEMQGADEQPLDHEQSEMSRKVRLAEHGRPRAWLRPGAPDRQTSPKVLGGRRIKALEEA